MAVTVLVGNYRPLPEPTEVMSRAAKVANTLKLRTPAKLYIYETLLERLPQHLQDMPAELRELIQKEHAIVGQRHLAWHRHLAATDQPHVGEGVVRGLRKPRSSYSPGLQNNVWLQAGWREAIAENGWSTAMRYRRPCSMRPSVVLEIAILQRYSMSEHA